MMTTLLLMAAFGQLRAPDGGLGRFTATGGSVSLVRAGQAAPAAFGVSIRRGDRVATAAGSGAAAFLDTGVSFYLGASTDVGINDDNRGTILDVRQGQARVISENPFLIDAPTATARVEKGILWVSVSSAGVRFWSQRGVATIAKKGQPVGQVQSPIRPVAYQQAANTVQLEPGSEVTIQPNGAIFGPVPATAQGWDISVDELQLAGAAAASRGRVADRLTTLAQSSQQQQPNQDQQQPEGTQEETNALANLVSGTGGVQLALSGGGGSSASGALGSFTGSASGGGFSAFPTSVSTVQTEYNLQGVSLNPNDNFASNPDTLVTTAGNAYWSISLGAAPTQQVSAGANGFYPAANPQSATQSDPVPVTLTIPHFNASVVQMHFQNVQFDWTGTQPVVDAAQGFDPTISTSGAVASTGTAPTVPNPAFPTLPPGQPIVTNATPVPDNQGARAPTANFGFGDIRLRRVGNLAFFSVRRSDVNTSVPGAVPTYGSLDLLHKAAVTTVLADQLYSVSQRTGATRFVIDGQIIDITGYRR